MSSHPGGPNPESSWHQPERDRIERDRIERDQIELGHEPATLSTRARLGISAGVILALTIGTAVVISSGGERDQGTSQATSATTPPARATDDSSASPRPTAHAAPSPPAAEIAALPVGAPAAQPYWSDGQLHFGHTSVRWRPAPYRMVSVSGSAFIVDRELRLLEVTGNGRTRLIDRDASGVLAVGGPRPLLYYTRALGEDAHEIVAWNPKHRATVARHTFRDASVCCDQSYAVIRGILPDGSVLVDNLDWVRRWRMDSNELDPYPLSGASAVRALSVGGHLLLVRDEHHSVADIELRTTRRPLLAGLRLRGVNEGLLSPDGRTLAAFSGTEPPYLAPTSALGIKTALKAVGGSVNVLDAMWDTTHTLVLQVATPGFNGNTLLIRCDAVTGSCARLPGDRPGVHQLPDGNGLTG
jgi:hypothetical protein